MLVRDPLASLQSTGSRTPAQCTFRAVPIPITLSLIEIHGYFMLRGRALVLFLLFNTILSAPDTISTIEGFIFFSDPSCRSQTPRPREILLAGQPPVSLHTPVLAHYIVR